LIPARIGYWIIHAKIKREFFHYPQKFPLGVRVKFNSPFTDVRCCFRNGCAGLVIFILLALAISACGSTRQDINPQGLSTTRVVPAKTATGIPTRQSIPSLTPSPTAEFQSSPTLTPTPQETATATQVPVRTPVLGPEAYYLQKWDQAAAVQALQGAENIPIPEEYEDLRGFYQVSMLDELFLDHPQLRSDRKYLLQMSQLKQLSGYWASYGLLHDHAVEPFRQLFERALNDGSADLSSIDQLNQWLEPNGAHADDLGKDTNKLIDRPGSTRVIKIFVGGGWGFFILHQEENGPYSVMALHPEWERAWWSDENFEITDLNANGRDEIALTYEGWGTGMTHYCVWRLNLYEWNGSEFKDLMADALEVSANTDYGDCIKIKFVSNPGGASKIQTGTTKYTRCDDLPYNEPIEFYWNGTGFVQKPKSIPTAPIQNKPSRCSIDWALKAGPENSTAIQLLTSALSNWPKEAEKDWGPAALDYFRLKLATWKIRRGELQPGLDQLRKVREHPAAPDYPLPAKIAGTFLDTYPAEGIYRAAQEVDSLYQKEIENIGGCGVFACDVEKLRQVWGFAEDVWAIDYGGGFIDDFQEMKPLTLAVKQQHFNNLETLQTWLKKNQLNPVWSAEGNLDDQGENDWLVILEFERKIINSESIKFYRLYGFLRNNGQTGLLPIDGVYVSEDPSNYSTIRWESFRPAQNATLLQVLQIGERLQAINVFQKAGAYQFKILFDTSTVLGWSSGDRAEVEDWKTEPGKLIIAYRGRQAEYIWDAKAMKMAPTGYAPDLQDEHVKEAEQAIYVDQNPERAVEILKNLLSERVWENYIWSGGINTNPPRVKPYMLYLLGLAYERSGDENNAVKTYWQLWHDYPAYPFSLAVQAKLVQR
jgi:hypothetical protein